MFAEFTRMVSGFAAVVLFAVLTAPLTAQTIPICLSASSDSDGDGFGWENRQSCRVVATVGTCRSAESDSDGDGFGWENGKSCRVTSAPVTCQNADSDPDGDGFGWENDRSCRVVAGSAGATPVCRSAESDPDGDGFGWENARTCRVAGSTEKPSAEERYTLRHPACSDPKYYTGGGYGWENSTTCTARNFGDGGAAITDVVLITGQSNALGVETILYEPDRYDERLDSPVKRVYAWTSTGWTIASLRQIWDRNWYPRSDIDADPANNFGFHFAKQMVLADPSRVVGIIMVTAPGHSISHWDKEGAFYQHMETKVTAALGALSHKSALDGVLWHQGESDYYDNDYYSEKLRTLIANLRAEPWLSSEAAFICGETLNSPVNNRLRLLNTDGDSKTGCVSADDLESVGDDIHFSTDSLRTIGERYATKYRQLSE
jgi:hypothetical protein